MPIPSTHSKNEQLKNEKKEKEFGGSVRIEEINMFNITLLF